MAFNDPIAELLTRIRNAKAARHRYVDLSLSKAKAKILEILKTQGFIENFLINNETRKMRIFLKYTHQRRPVLNVLTRKSTSGRRVYVGYDEIPRVQNGMGIAIISTPKGILDGETARNLKVGGELLCTIA